jgi:lipopolysaccharide export system permease protein
VINFIDDLSAARTLIGVECTGEFWDFFTPRRLRQSKPSQFSVSPQFSRLMLYQRAFASELRGTAAAVFGTLFVIALSWALIRVLGQAATGKIDPQSVFIILGFSLLNYAPMMLNLAVFAAVLLVLTRMYRDSEMVVWNASGVSLTQWIAPVLRFVVPVVMLGAFITFFVAPWANKQTAGYRDAFEKRDDISRFVPGQFRESAGAQRVFFVGGADEDRGIVQNVFIQSIKNGALSLVVADKGRIETRNEERYLILDNGRRYEVTDGSAEMRLLEFGRYTIKLDSKPPPPSDLNTPKNTQLHELVLRTDNNSRGELMWRIGVPLVGLMLALLAVPLSYFNPRSGRATPFITALLVFVVYVNLLTLMQNRVALGKTPFAQGTLLVHALVFIVAVWLLWLRDRPRRSSLLARRGRAG